MLGHFIIINFPLSAKSAKKTEDKTFVFSVDVKVNKTSSVGVKKLSEKDVAKVILFKPDRERRLYFRWLPIMTLWVLITNLGSSKLSPAAHF